MKKILFAMALVLSCFLAGCDGDVNPGNIEGAVTLYADKDIIMADDAYTVNFTVLLMDRSGVEHDVTSEVEIYYEGGDAPLATPDFKTAEDGEYKFYAVRGFTISNTVSVKAIKDVPVLPEDEAKGSVDFRHRIMLLQHTGNECPNCPRLMEVLKTLSEDEEYNDKYLHVASHSYNETDAAYSSAAATLSRLLNPTGYYPWLTYNLTTETGNELGYIKGAFERYHKDVALAGICASAVSVGNDIHAQVAVKAGVTSKYRVAVWLLEDNIRSLQEGATASWQHVHENCLRAMFGTTRNECVFGKPVGEVKAGETVDFIVDIPLESGWKAENCKLMVIAVAGNGDYELLNCAVCPVGGSVSYDYL